MIDLDLLHNDALDRTHANEGSIVNILQLSALLADEHETMINKSAKLLIGFNGPTSVTIGTINLSVYSPSVINSQTFMIIDEVSLTMHLGQALD